MFPTQLDGARVLYFTPESDYGVLYYDTGGIAAHFQYLAICKYNNDDRCYLFYCNEQKEVETDDLGASVEECMRIAQSSTGKDIAWIKITCNL